MSIEEIGQKIKGVGQLLLKRDIYGLCIVILVATGSFFIGRLSVFNERVTPVTIENISSNKPTVLGEFTESINKNVVSGVPEVPKTTPSKNGMYVGSKNSTKFHLPYCPGASQISEVNKVWFQTKEEALAKGYIPASNCKGI
jgi:hypothetical protein